MTLKRKLSLIAVIFVLMLTGCNLTGDDEEKKEPTSEAALSAGDSKPEVTINTPLTGSEVVVNTEVLVYSIARDRTGVTRVELRADGTVLNTVTSPNPSGQTELASLQSWRPTAVGTVTLEVIAYRGETASDPASVTVTVVQEESQVRTPAPTPTVVVPVQTADTSCRVRVNIDKLNVYAQPSNVSQIVQSAAIGEVIPLLGRTPGNEWWEINLRGQRGWIDAGYTSQLGNCSTLPVTGEVAIVPTATTVVTPTVDPRICTAMITTDNLQGRGSPGDDGAVVLSLRVNTSWAIFQRTGDGRWWQINVNGVLAWVPSGSIAVRGDCSGVLVATPSPEPNQPPVIASIEAQVLQTGTTATVNVTASDPDGDSLTLSLAVDNPAVVAANLQTATTILLTAQGAGLTTVTVTASDGQGGTVNQVFAVSVVEPAAPNQPPVINPVNDVEVVLATPQAVAIEVTDPEGQTPELSVTVGNPAVASAALDENNLLNLTPLTEGTTNVVVTADDGAGGTANIAFNVEVVEPTPIPNAPPTVATIENQTVDAGGSISVAVEASDPEGDAILLAAESSDATVAEVIVDASGTVVVTGVSGGQAEITVTVEDSAGDTASVVFTIEVIVPNQPPTIQQLGGVTLNEGESRAVAVVASDPDGQIPTLSAVSSDETIVTAETAPGQLVLAAVKEGSVLVTVTAEDSEGLTATMAFSVTVLKPVSPADNRPPVIDSINPQQVQVGETITVPVNVSDPEGATPVVTATSAAPGVASVVVNADGDLDITGLAVGQATINVIADDTQGKRTSLTFQVSVSPTGGPNQPPVVAPIDNVTLDIDETVTVPVTVTDPEGFQTFFSGVTSDDETVATVESDGAGNLLITALAPGRTRISLTVSDGQGGTATAAFNVTVNEAATATPDTPPVIEPIDDQTMVVGETITVPVTASDPEGTTTFFAEIESAAETIATVESDGAGNLIIEGLAPGTTQITVTVEDGSGSQAATRFTVTVLEPTPIPNDPPVVEPISDQSIEVGETVTVPVVVSDPEGTFPFFAEIESAAETIATVESDGAGNLLVTGVAQGSTEITLTVEDGDGLQTSVVFTVLVNVVPTETPIPDDPPVIEPIEAQTVIVGETVTIPVVASDPEGTQVFFAEIESAAETIATVESDGAGNLIIEGLAPGTTQITVTVEDGSGNQTETFFSVTVLEPTPIPNDPPVVEPIGDQMVNVGETVTVPVVVTDPEGTFPFFAEVESAAETIATVESDGVGNLLVTGVAQGSTQITLTVEDGDGLQTSVVFTVLVNVVPTETPIPDDPPVIEPIEAQTIEVGTSVTIPVVASDPEGTQVFFAEIESAAETIATVESDGAGNLIVSGLAPGQTEVTLVVEDGGGKQTETRFVVVVFEPTATPNNPPVVDPIPDQSLILGGDPVTIPVTASDPEGTQVFFAEVTSAAETIATAVSDGAGNVVVTAVAPGETLVTLTVEDGGGAQTQTSFTVTVLEPTETPNLPPTIDPIPDQTLVLGDEPVVVPVVASDPEGFNIFFAEVTSAAETIATAESDGAGNVVLTAAASGQTQVTVVVDDGSGLQASASFLVTVLEPTPVPNDPPVVDPINDQVLGVGETITVIVNAFDPEGFQPFLAEILSSAETIVTARPDGAGNVLITGVAPGQAAVTLTVDDGNGQQTQTTFQVLVTAPPTDTPAPNEPPVFQAVPDQAVDVGGFVTVPISVTDPEGMNVVLSAASNDETIAQVQLGEGAVTVAGRAPGTAVITVTADDTQGNVSSVIFSAIVTEGAVPTDEDIPQSPLADVPELPDLSGDVLATVQALYTAGSPNVFMVVGDTPNLLNDAGDGVYDLSGAGDLQDTLNVYLNQPLEDGNVLNRGNAAADENWKTGDLINPGNNPEGCTESNPVACALTAYQPSVVVVMVGRNDVLESTPLAAFETNLQLIVQTITSRGAIPVLVTIPGASVQVDPYNQAIANFAANNNLPLWNLWRSVPLEQVNSDLTLTSSGDGQNALLTAENLANYGTVKRNEMLLRLLKALRENVPLG